MPISVFQNLSNLFLKSFTVDALTTDCGRLFQSSMTLKLKEFPENSTTMRLAYLHRMTSQSIMRKSRLEEQIFANHRRSPKGCGWGWIEVRAGLGLRLI